MNLDSKKEKVLTLKNLKKKKTKRKYIEISLDIIFG